MLLQTGQTVGARRVGELGDAVWAPAAGNRTATGPLVLDRSNQLFGYIDGLEAVNVDLNDSSTLGFISGMDYYIGNLYMLDTTVSQLWRYRPTGDNYSDPREPYFPPESGTNLSTVIDAAIDGSVWLLNPNGNVVKYFGSQQEAFALESITPALSDAVEIWANDAEVPNGRLYIVDAASNRIVVFDKQGKLLSQMVPVDHPGILQDFRSLFVDEITNYMYILTGTGLYQVPLPAIQESPAA